MIDEIVIGIIIGLVPSCLIAVASLLYSKLKLRKTGLRVLMFRNDKTIETHLIPPDSKVFCWKEGQYVIREDHIRSARIGSGKSKPGRQCSPS